MDAAHQPYTDGVDYAVEAVRGEHEIVVVLDVHSIWKNKFGIIPSGPFANAYDIGDVVGRGSFDDGKMPDIIVMNSGGTSCAPEITNYLLSTFKRHGLIAEVHGVAGNAYDLPRSRIGNPARNIHAISIEIVGHELEPERALGIITEKPDPIALEKIQWALTDLREGLRTGKFRN